MPDRDETRYSYCSVPQMPERRWIQRAARLGETDTDARRQVGERHGPALLLLRSEADGEKVFSSERHQRMATPGRPATRRRTSCGRRSGSGRTSASGSSSRRSTRATKPRSASASCAATAPGPIIGRDVLDIGGNQRTMNFGWDLTRPAQEIDTAVHEIGHTLGFPHEHQNPNAGIVWDEEAVYAALAKPPNSWDRDTTFHNIIRKIEPDTVQGSNWDPNSIMHYPFEAGPDQGARAVPTGLDPAGGLSERDRPGSRRSIRR